MSCVQPLVVCMMRAAFRKASSGHWGRALIATSAYSAVAASIWARRGDWNRSRGLQPYPFPHAFVLSLPPHSTTQANEEPEDDPSVEQTVALLDNRLRNYSAVPQEVQAFYDGTLKADPAPTRLIKWTPSSGGVERPQLIRSRGGEAELHSNYDIHGSLGSGAFATVRKAVDRSTGLPRAIKTVHVVRPEGESAEATSQQLDSEWERMLTEVDALMKLTHPNIVRLHEYYEVDKEALYLVEEYCSGGTLEALLKKRGGRMHADETAYMLRQMLRGVLCCHAHGLAHRDLKPDNFVLASKDSAAALKLIDFGLTLNDTWTHVPSKYAHMAGTLEHSAPETFAILEADGNRRRPRYGQAADMWSLGVIFYQLLVGEPLLNLDRERSSSAEFARMVKSVAGGTVRDIIDDAGAKVRTHPYMYPHMRTCTHA